tara:strand:+ start:1006 stop:1941 length:936 start_codon:yes stop_codon:yes gene_type:complete
LIIVTGACGFIGSRVIEGLHKIGRSEKIIAVDYISDENVRKISSFPIYDFISPETFLKNASPILEGASCVFHQGAISDTTYEDTSRLMLMNHQYTKSLISKCIVSKTKIIYASSAAVYGNGKKGFREDSDCESPMNVYGFSKVLVDNWVRQNNFFKNHEIFGLRYFNVYGKGEEHKKGMSSPIYKFFQDAISKESQINIFEGSESFYRDFVSIDDVVKVNLDCAFGKIQPGIYNVGSGESVSFSTVAEIVRDFVSNEVKIVPTVFPKKLKSRYQENTKADLSQLRKAGYRKKMVSPEKGIKKYLLELKKEE